MATGIRLTRVGIELIACLRDAISLSGPSAPLLYIDSNALLTSLKGLGSLAVNHGSQSATFLSPASLVWTVSPWAVPFVSMATLL